MHTTPAESTWGIVAQEYASAPARTRRRIHWLAGGIAASALVAVVDTATGSPGLEAVRLAGLVIGVLGISLLGLGQLLYHAAERDAGTAGPSVIPPQPRALHRMMLALPMLLLASAVLFAMAIGLLASSIVQAPFVIVPIVAYGWLLMSAARGIARTGRVLYGRALSEAAASARAEARAADARVAAMQAQMQPHFLFNALNTVASLVRTDARAAERTVEHLADVLRRTLHRSRTTTGTVGDELEYLRAYLGVEHERWGDRLEVRWDVDDTAETLPLPPLVLQPLVENALRHGVGGRLAGGAITIRAYVDAGTLILGVEDDGPGFPERWIHGTGLGLLRDRLEAMYGDRARLRIGAPLRSPLALVRAATVVPRGAASVGARQDPGGAAAEPTTTGAAVTIEIELNTHTEE